MIVLLTSYLFCYSQDATYYVGKGKIYQLQLWNVDAIVYFANFNSTYETVYGEQITSNKICIYNSSNVQNYTSSYGDYIEIHHSQEFSASQLYTHTRNMLFFVTGYGICAFTLKNKTLSLVKFYDDTLISVLDDNFICGDDFSIFVRDGNRMPPSHLEPSFWILNNGYIKYYSNVSSIASSVNAVKMDDVKGKQYNIGGVETNNPKNDVYIQDGKKYIIK